VEEEIFCKEFYTSKGRDEMKRMFDELHEMIEKSDIPHSIRISERKWLTTYMKQCDFFYFYFKNLRN